jgi:hypothetical protein
MRRVARRESVIGRAGAKNAMPSAMDLESVWAFLREHRFTRWGSTAEIATLVIRWSA